MNTADRSIALIDIALRCRFQFIEKMPNVNVLRKIGADKVNEAGIELDVAAMLETINERITYLFDREHTIGHAFFTGLKDEPTVAKQISLKSLLFHCFRNISMRITARLCLYLATMKKNTMNRNLFLLQKQKQILIFRGDTSDIDIPDYSYTIQESAFLDIMSYIEITG